MADAESSSRKTSLILYATLVLWAAAVAATSQAISSSPVREIAWPQVILAALGLPAILLLRKAKLPELWNQAGPKRILAIPFLVGLAFGGINVICIEWLMPVDRDGPMPPFLQPFPWSVALFSAGAVVMEAMFCLIPLPLVTAALLRVSRSPAANWPFLTAAALVVSAQTLIVFQELPSQIRILALFLAALALIQVIFFRRYGYLASLSTRLGHYAVWHIGFGLWFQRLI